MKLSTKISTILGAGAIIALTALFGLTTTANADCIYQYNPGGFTTSNTPVFNKICGVPDLGDESQFVRIRPDVDGDESTSTNYTIGQLDSTCSAGDKFDVWNYIHNDATANDNPDVGDGSSVAVGTYIDMTAPINTTSDSFSFSGTVGDTGNLTGTAGPTSTTNITPAVLNCGGNQVQLSLVPGSVNEFSVPYGKWINLPQNAAALNTNLPLGSTNAGASSANGGTMWSCWNYRIVVVYQVEVTPVTPTQTPPTCNQITANDQADVENISYTANSATITGYNIGLYSGNQGSSGKLLASSGNIGLNQLPYQFKYSLANGTPYSIVANVLYTLNGSSGSKTGPGCETTFTTSTPPTTPPTTPPSTPPVTSLTNTGPGTVGTLGIFLGASALGSGIYYWFLKKRLASKG